MSTYTVVKAPVQVKELDPSGDRPKLFVWKFTLKNSDGKEAEVEQVTLSADPPHAEGASVEGSLEQTPYGWRFKKATRGSFGGRPMDPARENRIVRQHSQEMALRFCQIKATTGELPKNYTRDQLRELIDWFAEDAA